MNLKEILQIIKMSVDIDIYDELNAEIGVRDDTIETLRLYLRGELIEKPEWFVDWLKDNGIEQ